MNKPLLIILLVAIIGVAFGGYYFYINKGSLIGGDNSPLGRHEVAVSVIPEGFPTSIKIPSEGKVVDSFNYGATGNKLQATRIVESTKSVDENFKYYSGIVSSRYGWLVQSVSTSSQTTKAIFAQNTDGRLAINITKTSVGSKVDISFLMNK